MITSGYAFVGVLLGLAALIVWFEKRKAWKLFKYVPGFVLLYIGAALLNTFGAFGDSKEIENVGGSIRDLLLPAMILLFLFKCDLRKIVKLGPKLLITFFMTTVSMIVAFTAVFFVFQGLVGDEAWKGVGALSASWTGGSANMVAVQGILHAPQDIFGYVLIVDTLMYSIWLLIMFGSVAWSDKFNRWTKADVTYLNAHTGSEAGEADKPMDLASLLSLIGFSIMISAAATWIGTMLPDIGIVINSTTWTILIVSVLGLVLATTPIGKTAGSADVAQIMLYMIIGIIASGSDFTSIADAPAYLLIGALVLVVHAGLMTIYAKLTKTELFSLAVASTAHVGGVASAPVVAGAFNRQLVPVGVLFALIGAFMGTIVGLLIAQILAVI
ncbi:DUF819 family protein [Spelaeicoccus albus]|uniref:Putative membrane protein n=1 Tax=Spelaeicoccus albus TaxID=1280376 RepID=A0A7Z0AC73_9MICO|nr:DUF819 family protein [Spelaeicoccus albus]NYI67235.1 putative membrane protein [Spelaeicoccus albus]